MTREGIRVPLRSFRSPSAEGGVGNGLGSAVDQSYHGVRSTSDKSSVRSILVLHRPVRVTAPSKESTRYKVRGPFPSSGTFGQVDV